MSCLQVTLLKGRYHKIELAFKKYASSSILVSYFQHLSLLLLQFGVILNKFHLKRCAIVLISVGDPDPHVFGLLDPDPDPLVRIRLRILPFSHKCVERTEIMPAKLNCNTEF